MSGVPNSNRVPQKYELKNTETGEVIYLDGINPTDGCGLPAVDITPLRAEFLTEAHDPGLKSTESCASEITFIDGAQGVLLHRGYTIADLTENSSFPEVAYLLYEGELPTAEELATFEDDITDHSHPPEVVIDLILDSDPKAKPMDVLASATASLAAHMPEDDDPRHLIGRMSAIVANIIRHQQGKQKFLYPDVIGKLTFAENFLYMAFADDEGDYDANPVVVEAMDKLLILHADHEQNASTTAMRSTRSAGSTMAESLTAAVSTLAGPLHGGANQKVLEQLKELHEATQDGGSLDDHIAAIIDRAKDKTDSFRLMGFGHRVYKNRDPRAMVLKRFVDDLLDNLNIDDPRLEIARKLEAAAAQDEYFTSRGLYPNVDFYSGIAMAAMDLEPELFTTIFALGRTAGWGAQAAEHDAHKIAITRPRQAYIGEAERPYVPMHLRTGSNGGPALDDNKPFVS